MKEEDSLEIAKWQQINRKAVIKAISKWKSEEEERWLKAVQQEIEEITR